MSLRVWLPLTKDLKNQGLDDVTVTNNGATFNSTGKLGGCYYFNNAYAWLPMDYSTFGTEFSVAFWYKIDTAFSGNRHLVCLCNQYGWPQLKFTCAATSNSTLAFNIGDGSTSARSLSTSQIIGSWQHICFTFNNKIAKVYVNGVQTGTATYSINPDWSGTTKMGIGGVPDGHECAITLSLNDVRIYDHCLSPLEVKEISKGLILHYPLNRGGWGQENLIAGTDFNGSSKKYTITSGTEGGFFYTPTETILANTEYTVSCQLRGNANMNLYKLCTGGNESINWVNRSQLSITEYKPFSITFTYPSSKTLNQIYICTRYGTSNTSTGDWFEIKPNSLKLEKGSIATPWCPNSSDTLATAMELNGNIEYDCSGYCNNGTRTGIFSWTSDTPKYEVSTNFSTISQHVHLNYNTNGFKDSYSISLWLKYNSTQTNSAPEIFGIPAYACLYISGNLIYWNTNDGTNNPFKNNGSTLSITPYVNNWHHFVITGNGTNVILYIDGVKAGRATTYKHFGGNKIVLSDKDNTRNTYSFIGLVSDFRIYATALSAEDVKSFYNNSAYIDNQGNIYGAVYEEV